MLGREVTKLLVKHDGIELPDPTLSNPDNWTESCIITGHLVEAIGMFRDFFDKLLVETDIF